MDGDAQFVTSLSGTNTTASYLWNTDEVEPGTHTVSVASINAEGQVTLGSLSLLVE